MSFLKKLFSSRKSARKELVDSLNGVDFHAAAENIAFTFREAARKAEAEGGHSIMEKEFVSAAECYMENPCLESAIMLLEKYPSFLKMFEFTKDPLQSWARNFRKRQ